MVGIAFEMLDVVSAEALRGTHKERSPVERDVDVRELAAGSPLLSVQGKLAAEPAGNTVVKQMSLLMGLFCRGPSPPLLLLCPWGRGNPELGSGALP